MTAIVDWREASCIVVQEFSIKETILLCKNCDMDSMMYRLGVESIPLTESTKSVRVDWK